MVTQGGHHFLSVPTELPGSFLNVTFSYKILGGPRARYSLRAACATSCYTMSPLRGMPPRTSMRAPARLVLDAPLLARGGSLLEGRVVHRVCSRLLGVAEEAQ